jgi:hypothetical protein
VAEPKAKIDVPALELVPEFIRAFDGYWANHRCKFKMRPSIAEFAGRVVTENVPCVGNVPSMSANLDDVV